MSATTQNLGEIRIAQRRGVRKSTPREHYVVKLRKADGTVFEAAFTPKEVFDASQRKYAFGPQLG